jgi:hypothetical protein
MIAAGIVAGLGVAGQMASGIMSARSRRAEFDQQLRATMMKRDQTLSLATARAAASGFEIGSRSTTEYLAALTGEFNIEIDNIRKARDTSFLASILGTLAGGVGGTAGALTNFKKASGTLGNGVGGGHG